MKGGHVITQKEKIMKLLGCSEAEAEAVLASDKKIDKGEKMPFDLPPELEKQAKKMANVGTRKTPIMFDNKPRERKPNLVKSNVIAKLYKFLTENAEICVENAEITNKERQIAFKIGENDFELTLVQKRKAK